MDDQALLPTDYSGAVDEFRDVSSDKVEQLERLEKSFHSLSEHPGWAHLRRWIEEQQQSLKTLAELPITGKESPAEIGFRFIVASLAAEKLQGVIDAVEDTRVAEDEAD